MTPFRRVLLIVIDAFASDVVEPALAAGELPNMQALVERGQLQRSCSIFPSITPAATATLVTGEYPASHGIAGAYWYNDDADTVSYFGDDIWVILAEGVGSYFEDFLQHLNRDRLRTELIFERVERHGLTAGTLNYMWFRGQHSHEVHAPLLLRLMPGASAAFSTTIAAAKHTTLGDFVLSRLPGSEERFRSAGGFRRRYGFHDETTREQLLQLTEHGEWPDFTLAYFPNNDFESHNVGRRNAFATLQRVDQTLGEVFERCGGIDAFLRASAVLMTGDHSQSDTLDDEDERRIELEDVLTDFRIVPAGETWSDGDELMVCPNMRAAQIYLKEGVGESFFKRLLANLGAESRIDQILWRIGDRYFVRRGEAQLVFSRQETSGARRVIDEQENVWFLGGDLSPVDAQVNGDRLTFGDYPNALERIEGAFGPRSGEVWITATPGCEFAVPRTETHPGGSHGSLHALDSISPLITAGLPAGMTTPRFPRSRDIVPLSLQILGITR